MAYTNFTNCTKEQYESIIYSEEDKNRIRIWFNNVELLDADEYCESFSGTNRILPDDGNKIFTLDNFVAKNYTLILRDLPEGTIISDQVKVSIGTLVNENNNTYEDVPIGIFNIQDTPINDKGRVTIKLRDNRVKFDFNYNAQPLIESLGGTATKKQILEDICNQAGVTNNVSTFDGEDDEIGIYDNTITATTYVSYIFEQAGLMPFINREGQLDKINLNDLKVWRIPLSIVEKYEKGTPFKIERVVYESGIIKYESSNDESLDTLYLNSANPYINDKQQIDNIYNLLVGFSADSVKSGRILGNPAIDPFDMILIYDDEINDNPISTSTGTNLTLENTPNASTNIDLLGNTTQDTTTGKNLLPNDLATKTINGITITKNNDGTYKVNGTATSDVSEAICNNFISMSGTWRMLGCPSGGSSSTYMLSAYVGYWGAGSPNIDTGSGTNITYTGNVKVRFYIKSGTTCNNLIFKPMLTTDTSTTINNWERYTYGASPNPNYPQPIETTTGRNTIDVCGKNRLPISSLTSSTLNGITFTNNNDGSYTFNGTATSYTAFNLFTNLSFNGNYTYVLKDTATSGFTMYLQNSAGTGIGSTTTHNTINNNIARMIIGINNGTTLNNLTIKPYVYNGNYDSSTSYEPYIGNSYEVNLGKNLLNIYYNKSAGYTYTQNGITETYNADGSITFKGTATAQSDFYITTNGYPSTSTFLYLDKTKKYTMSLTGNNTNTSNIRLSIGYNTTAYHCNTTSTFTPTTDIAWAFIRIMNGAVVDTTIYPQLEKGNQATSYSPYFPPIELCKIGDYQDRLFKASGKNLFDKSTITNGYRLDESGAPSEVANNEFTSDFISVKPNTTYVRNIGGISAYTRTCFYDSSKTFISKDDSNQTFTTPSNAYYLRFSEYTSRLNTMQLEEGSSSSSYEPYGNYWYKYKAIGKVILNGSESGWMTQQQTGFYRYGLNISNINNNSSLANQILIMANQFRGITFNARGNDINETIYVVNNGQQNQFFVNTKLFDTIANFKTHLNSNNLIIYYVLATPTYTKIENEELIGQLNRLKTIQTIEGTTNIQQNNSSEPFELNVEYFNESYILKTLANNTYKYTGINRNEFNTEISLEQRKENVSIKSEATYQKLAKTEIDSANASINMITEELGFVDGNSQVIESIKTTQTQNSLDIEAITSYQEIDGERVLTGVKTGKGFTFNNSGLIIQSTDNTYKAVHNEMGDYYYDGDTPLGETTNEGSKFKNMDLYGEFRYGKDDIDDNALFVSMKFTDDDGEECFGHFYNQ